MSEKEKTVPFTIRITESQKKALEAIADREQRSVNNVINLAIQQFLRNHHKD